MIDFERIIRSNSNLARVLIGCCRSFIRTETFMPGEPKKQRTPMNRTHHKFWALALAFVYITSACNLQGTPKQSAQLNAFQESELKTQEAQTAIAAHPTATVEPATPSKTPEPSPTITLTPTITPTPTETPPMISVTANTNCRSGPGTSYAIQGVLLVGESAEIVARSTIVDYWYIFLPEAPGEPCWMSGAYANSVGDTSLLPELTPMPTPAPPVGFDLYLRGFESCGSITYVVFSAKNAGVEILKSAKVGIVDFNTGGQLYGPDFQRFPFAQVVRPVCPPDHGNILLPGTVQYIHVPISPVPHGNNGIGTIMLCTADWLGGDCVTKVIYFLIE